MNEDYNDLDAQLAEFWGGGGGHLSESGCLERNLKDDIKTNSTVVTADAVKCC
jgi:hypothetical protein